MTQEVRLIERNAGFQYPICFSLDVRIVHCAKDQETLRKWMLLQWCLTARGSGTTPKHSTGTLTIIGSTEEWNIPACISNKASLFSFPCDQAFSSTTGLREDQFAAGILRSERERSGCAVPRDCRLLNRSQRPILS